MNKFLEAIDRSRTEHKKRQDNFIEKEIRSARLLLDQLEKQDDPYAMHKALESIDGVVLVYLLARKMELRIDE